MSAELRKLFSEANEKELSRHAHTLKRLLKDGPSTGLKYSNVGDGDILYGKNLIVFADNGPYLTKMGHDIAEKLKSENKQK